MATVCAFLQSTRQVTHTRTDSAQKESTLRRREAIAWPGATRIRTGSRVVVAVLNNISMPTTDELWLVSVAAGRKSLLHFRISHRLHHRRHHSAASLACTPSIV